MRPLLMLFTALVASSASYASNCKLPDGPVRDVLFRENENCQLAEELSHNILSLQQTFKTGPEVVIVMGGRSTNASFDNGHLLWIPQVLFSSDAHGQIQESTVDELKTVVLHEYGHAVFNEILKAEFKEEFGEIFDELNSISDEAEFNLITRIQPRGFRNRGGQLAYTPEFMTFFQHIPSYSELYADTLAVLYMNDPAAMSKAMRFASGTTATKLLVQMRDFSQTHSLEMIQKANDAHTELSLVRTFIGEKVEGMDHEGKIEFLGRFESALVKSIRENMKAPVMPSIEKKNHNLIKLLKEKN